MPIRKQEFYEGAALHQLVRSATVTSIRYESPLFILDDRLLVYMKYSTKTRSPWGFTFMPDEQLLLERKGARADLVIGLICGSDGVAALCYEEYGSISPVKESAIHIACYRHHGEHYEVWGPEGALQRKVAPSHWRRLLTE